MTSPHTPDPTRTPLRGIAVLGAPSVADLSSALGALLEQASAGSAPPPAPPNASALAAAERVAIDYGDAAELAGRLEKARKALEDDGASDRGFRERWASLEAHGVFRGRGPAAGTLAFLFTGQGSQYVNMGRDLAEAEPGVKAVFDEADQVLEPVMGQALTSYVFVDGDRAAQKAAEQELKQTAITQPAVLTLDIALARLLGEFGIEPDLVMGHSLGEYGALVSAGVLSAADAIQAAAARGGEMSRVSVGDNGAMAAVMGPVDMIQEVLGGVEGYVVPANLNSRGQCVIGGETAAVEAAIAVFKEKDVRAQQLPVSHAFHTKIVAPAAEGLRQVLRDLEVRAPGRRVVANVTADFYPEEPDAIRELLCRQIASPVRWVESLEKAYDAGVRAFVEVGPKRALKGFVEDVLGDKPDVTSVYTNRARPKEIATFNQALCGLYAAGYGPRHPARA